jgi:hypothetical protein
LIGVGSALAKIDSCTFLGLKGTLNLLRVRVTRLDEFSPFGRLFSLGSFLRLRKYPKILGNFFRSSGFVVLILAKNGLGYILGDFFTNSSGHPVADGVARDKKFRS